MADEAKNASPTITFTFSSRMELRFHERIRDSLASFVAELIKAYTKEERTFEDEMLLNMLAKGHFVVNDIDDKYRGWHCVICNHTQVRERMSQGLPFMINFHVQGFLKG